MTDFDYGLANHAIRITSDRSDCVCLWFWPQVTGITDRMIAAAKQDIWEARREPRGQVFCGERRGKQCDLSLDQLRAWKKLVRGRFEYKETRVAILSWGHATRPRPAVVRRTRTTMTSSAAMTRRGGWATRSRAAQCGRTAA